MSIKIAGEVTLTYVNGGISKEKKNPYLQVSDGVEAKFINIPKNIDREAFTEFCSERERGDQITVEVEVDPFSGRMTLINFGL